MSDETAFLHGHVPEPDPAGPIPHSRAMVLGGRPPIDLCDDLITQICDLIADGKTISQIAALKGMPSRSTIRRWIAKNERIRAEYALAKEEFADAMLGETIAIADDSSHDTELVDDADGMPTVKANKEALGRSALRIDTRFRVLAKMMPHKYGDIPTVTVNTPLGHNEPPARNGDNAKIINGEVIPFEQHPLYESAMAWGKVARGEKL